MPINIDEFEAGGDREPSTSERVVRFLREHDDQAFTRREIADAIEVAAETVGTNLTRLKRRGVVRHREPYWAITNDAGQEKEGGSPHEPGVTAGLDDANRGDFGPHARASAAFFDRVRAEVTAVDVLYLFGSVARGTASPDSDVDVLAVVSADADIAAVDDRLLEIAYDVQLDHGVTVEVHLLDADEFEARKQRGEPFVRTVVEEGVVGD